MGRANKIAIKQEERHGLCPVEIASANINPDTLLATDYLNHFNEVIMLFEMLPDMPDCLEDIEAWRPKTYIEHFADSGFQGKELAITAYKHASRSATRHFEDVCMALDVRIISATRDAKGLSGSGRMEEFAHLCQSAHISFSPLLDELNAIIHGSIDEGEMPMDVADFTDHDHAQAEIDALFD